LRSVEELLGLSRTVGIRRGNEESGRAKPEYPGPDYRELGGEKKRKRGRQKEFNVLIKKRR